MQVLRVLVRAEAGPARARRRTRSSRTHEAAGPRQLASSSSNAAQRRLTTPAAKFWGTTWSRPRRPKLVRSSADSSRLRARIPTTRSAEPESRSRHRARLRGWRRRPRPRTAATRRRIRSSLTGALATFTRRRPAASGRYRQSRDARPRSRHRPPCSIATSGQSGNSEQITRSLRWRSAASARRSPVAPARGNQRFPATEPDERRWARRREVGRTVAIDVNGRRHDDDAARVRRRRGGERLVARNHEIHRGAGRSEFPAPPARLARRQSRRARPAHDRIVEIERESAAGVLQPRRLRWGEIDLGRRVRVTGSASARTGACRSADRSAAARRGNRAPSRQLGDDRRDAIAERWRLRVVGVAAPPGLLRPSPLRCSRVVRDAARERPGLARASGTPASHEL